MKVEVTIFRNEANEIIEIISEVIRKYDLGDDQGVLNGVATLGYAAGIFMFLSDKNHLHGKCGGAFEAGRNQAIMYMRELLGRKESE